MGIDPALHNSVLNILANGYQITEINLRFLTGLNQVDVLIQNSVNIKLFHKLDRLICFLVCNLRFALKQQFTVIIVNLVVNLIREFRRYGF